MNFGLTKHNHTKIDADPLELRFIHAESLKDAERSHCLENRTLFSYSDAPLPGCDDNCKLEAFVEIAMMFVCL